MNQDERILEAFKKAHKLGMKEIDSGTVSAFTNIPHNNVCKKLNILSKFDLIEPTQKRKVRFWSIID